MSESGPVAPQPKDVAIELAQEILRACGVKAYNFDKKEIKAIFGRFAERIKSEQVFVSPPTQAKYTCLCPLAVPQPVDAQGPESAPAMTNINAASAGEPTEAGAHAPATPEGEK